MWRNSRIFLFVLLFEFGKRHFFFGHSSAAPNLIAKFQVDSVSATSIVIQIVGIKRPMSPTTTTTTEHHANSALSRIKLEMKITIYDLEKLREFRKSELTSTLVNLENSQLFSFDGLLSNNWFAIRIDYRLLYYEQNTVPIFTQNNRRSTPQNQTTKTEGGGSSFQDFPTKQDIIVRTRNESKNPYDVEDHGFKGDEERIVQIEKISSSFSHLNLTMNTIFPFRQKLSTIVVPELRCLSGIIKPSAQRILSRTTVSFDLRKLTPLSSQPMALSTSNKNTGVAGPNPFSWPMVGPNPGRKQCFQLCIFPFIRAEIDGTQQTFRGKEICESPTEMVKNLRQKLYKQPHKLRSAKLPQDQSGASSAPLETTSSDAYFDADEWNSGAKVEQTFWIKLFTFLLINVLKFL